MFNKSTTNKQLGLFTTASSLMCKLISSNIAWYSRYEIIRKTLLMSVDKGVASRISDQLVRLKAEVMTVIKVKDDKWKIPVKTKEGKDTYRYFGCKYSSGDVTTKN